MSSLFDAADDLPCADFGLLGPLKRSPEYAALRRRVAKPKPADAWQVNGEHYFVFQLRPASDETAFALFKMRWEDDRPVAALIVKSSLDGEQVEVSDVRQPGTFYVVSLSGE